MKYKVTIELNIDTKDYEDVVGETSLEDIVCDELSDLMRVDILSCATIEEVSE